MTASRIATEAPATLRRKPSLRVGIEEVVAARREVRLAPVSLLASQ
jgi:hypothetical protein